MNIQKKHASRTKNIVLAIAGVLTLGTGALAAPQLTNALSFPTTSNSGGTSNILTILTGGSNANSNAGSSSSTSVSSSNSSTTTSGRTNTPSTSTTVTTPATPVTPTTTTTVTTPSVVTQAATATPAPTVSPSTTTTSTVSKTPAVASSSTSKTTLVKAVPIDTAAQVALTARAQAVSASTKIAYHSNRISSDTAMAIYKVAAGTALLALILLGATGVLPPVPFTKRQAVLSHS